MSDMNDKSPPYIKKMGANVFKGLAVALADVWTEPEDPAILDVQGKEIHGVARRAIGSA